VRAWREAKAEVRLVTWAQNRGIDDTRLIRRIARILGEDAIERLERNPWCLVPFLPWQKVDGLGLRVAREDGIAEPEDELNRLVGAVDAAVKDLIETGATSSSDRDMRARVAAKLKVPRDHRRVEAAMLAGVRNSALVIGEDGQWRAPGCAMMEDAILMRLRELSAKESTTLTSGQPMDSEAALVRYERSAGPLHPEQRAAVLKVLHHPFSCLQGGAGVGKTHTTKAICAVWEARGGKVLLAALAGKAVLRLHHSTGRLARTLFRTIQELDERARILERKSDPELDPSECAALDVRLLRLAEITPRTLVLIDEASMVDIATLHALLRRMPQGAHLLMVGDDRQLPPVSFGLTFHRVVADLTITARLTVVHRQARETGIPSLAVALRDRQMPSLPQYTGLPQDGVFLLPASSPDEISEGAVRVVQELAHDELMVIVPTNEGQAGVRNLNKKLHRLHLEANGGLEISNPLGEWFSVGEPYHPSVFHASHRGGKGRQA
jgi:exodeoxyribonuclease V alpha subunit